ncbi:transposase [Methyloversatilis universalis]|uniref:transposase n=1 Tax=Methyloversatilis universalis TaxID=378211 RepID=UPI001E547B15|nr:transposase [Methyloversatilis universalis]
MKLLLDAIRLLEARIARLEQELSQLARQSAACTRRLTIPGIGLLTATAMVAATGGSVSHFRDARHFASWFGLSHGARACLRAATLAARADHLDALRQWAVNIQARTHPRARWPTGSHASATACCAMPPPTENRNPGWQERPTGLRSPRPPEQSHHLPPPLATRQIARSGQPGHPLGDERR